MSTSFRFLFNDNELDVQRQSMLNSFVGSDTEHVVHEHPGKFGFSKEVQHRDSLPGVAPPSSTALVDNLVGYKSYQQMRLKRPVQYSSLLLLPQYLM